MSQSFAISHHAYRRAEERLFMDRKEFKAWVGQTQASWIPINAALLWQDGLNVSAKRGFWHISTLDDGRGVAILTSADHCIITVMEYTPCHAAIPGSKAPVEMIHRFPGESVVELRQRTLENLKDEFDQARKVAHQRTHGASVARRFTAIANRVLDGSLAGGEARRILEAYCRGLMDADAMGCVLNAEIYERNAILADVFIVDAA